MARWRLPAAACAVCALLLPLFALADRSPSQRQPAARSVPSQRAAAALHALPTAFEPVSGGFVARGSGYEVFLDGSGAALALRRGNTSAILRSRLAGARRVAPMSESRLPGVVNDYRGSTPRERIPTYARVRFPAVYPGIDAVYHGRAG